MDAHEALLRTHHLTTNSHLLLSPFIPESWVEGIIAMGVSYTYVDVTLQGFIDMRMLAKALRTLPATHVVRSPFNNAPDPIQTTLTAINLPLEQTQANPEILALYDAIAKTSKDVTTFSHPNANAFALFLAPYLFCPKEEILASMRQANIPYTLLSKPQESLFVAHQVWQSFIGLPIDVTLDEAQRISENFFAILEQHALRRCTF